MLQSPAQGFLFLGGLWHPQLIRTVPQAAKCVTLSGSAHTQREIPVTAPLLAEGGLKTRNIPDEVMGRAAGSRIPRAQQTKQHVVTQLCHPHQGPGAGTCSMDWIPLWNSATLVTHRGWDSRCVVQSTDTQQSSGMVWGG